MVGRQVYDGGSEMDELSAYVALISFARGRDVVVHGARRAEGLLMLARQAAGLREVGEGRDVADDTALRWHEIESESVDVVCSVETFHSLGAAARGEVLREVSRVLRPTGVFAAWLPSAGSSAAGLDYWRLEHELNSGFEFVRMVAQMPWAGSCFAPVLDSGSLPDVTLSLDERLCPGPVDASAYLAFASNVDELRELDSRCLLIAAPPFSAGTPRAVGPSPGSSTRSEPTAQPCPRCDALDGELSHACMQLDEVRLERQDLRGELDGLSARRSDDLTEIARLRDEVTRWQRAATDAVESLQAVQRELDTRAGQVGELEVRIERLRRAIGQVRPSEEFQARALRRGFGAPWERAELEAKTRSEEQVVMLAQLEQLETRLRASSGEAAARLARPSAGAPGGRDRAALANAGHGQPADADAHC
ncbi:MAG: methyltransferase domain-containing protein [Myxococcales bacterium FL481]|nr:MAG: methyltransferase domain-containing protein [Myxococcales bacterium FL481]